MTKRYFLIASRGRWISTIPASEEEKRRFVPSIETNNESLYEEVTDEYKTQYEEQWEKDHPAEETLELDSESEE